MAGWIALLVVGVVVVVGAAIALMSASSARSQATAAEQRYLTPTSSSPSAPQDSRSSLPKPADSPAPKPKPAVGQESSAPLATAPAPRTIPRPTVHPSPSPPLLSTPTSIELAGSHNPIPVVPIGVSAAGVLEPPSDISTAGWWVSGPRPGAPGRAVITGHIDSTAGLGAFAALDLLRSGDAIALHEADGRILQFKVTDRQQIEKTQLDPGLLQHTTNVSDLLLVTCIGNFNYSTRSYDSNLLITAVPVAH